MKHFNKTILLVLAMCISLYGFAQSSSSYGGTGSAIYISTGTTASDAAETLYIGPGTHTINGIWEIYAKNITISSNAIIEGTGTIKIYNPSAAGGTSSATLIDGNYGSNAIGVNIELNNASGVTFTNANFLTEFTNAGWTENTAASSVAVDKDLNLNADGANITLGTTTKGDLIFTSNGSISNYGLSRMIITNNSITSHVIKQNYTTAFVFPIGIASGDYTPAKVSNASAVDVMMSVQDYANSAADESKFTESFGINRTWHIYGSAAGTGSTITLQHNSTSNGTDFQETSHYVSKYNSQEGAWQVGSSGGGTAGSMRQAEFTPSSKITAVPGSSEKSGDYAALPLSTSGESAYFTKRTTQSAGALPIKILSFEAVSKTCDADIKLVAELDNDIQTMELQRSSNSNEFSTIHQWAGVGTFGVKTFTFTDKTMTGNQNYYYKVKITYNTGIIEYSGIAAAKVDCGNGQTILMFPNPASGYLNIEGMPANTQKVIQVIDMSGKTWHQLSTANTVQQLNVQRLPAGTYVLRIFNTDGTVYLLKKFSKL